MLRRVANAPARHISAAEAAALVRPGMWLDFGGVNSQPDVFDRALACAPARALGREDPLVPVGTAAAYWRPIRKAGTSRATTGISAATTG